MEFSEETNIHISRYKKFIFSMPNRKYIVKSGLVKHHIVPKSMGGSNDVENISILTVREHYIAHLMLWKAYGSKMSRAFWLLANIEGKRITSRQYESLKKDILVSPETRMKMSISKKGIKVHLTEEQKKNKSRKSSEIMKEHYKTHEHPRGFSGNKHSEETKKRLSENHKGVPKSEETKRKLSEAHSGKVLSEEHKGKLSIAASKRIMTKEARFKISESKKGEKKSVETRRKMSEASKIRETKRKEKGCISSLKGKSSGPMQEHVKLKISEANKGKKRSEETKLNIKNAWVKRKEEKQEKKLKEIKIEF